MKIGWIFLLISSTSFAQYPDRPQLDKLAVTYSKKSFPLFYELLSLKNDAHFPEDIEKNIRWCEKAFSQRKFTTKRLNTSTLPLLLAERKNSKANQTVLIYLQIDGQPVDPSKWNQPDPWKPVLKEKNAQGNWMIIDDSSLNGTVNPEWRIFARSASDAKGPVAAFLAASDALDDLNLSPDFSIKVIMDFEEELGSPRLPSAVAKYKEDLKADMLIIFDGPRHVSNQPTLSFGARGICEMTITTFGTRTPVHSGNYGNYAPNAAFRLASLLSSMKSDNGRVTIPGFYDGVTISPEKKKILAEVPDNEEEILRFLGIAEPEKVGSNFQEAMQYPTLNIRGMKALYTGSLSRTLIPDHAIAELDIRLVPASDPMRLIGLVKQHIANQGFYITDSVPTEEQRMKYPKMASVSASVSYGAFQTPFDSKPGIWLTNAMKKAFGRNPVRVSMTGGSIPIAPFINTLGIPAVSVPTVNADNNQHAENENIRLGNYMDAVKTFIAILTEKMK